MSFGCAVIEETKRIPDQISINALSPRHTSTNWERVTRMISPHLVQVPSRRRLAI